MMLMFAPEVAQLLGSEDAMLRVAQMAAQGFRCTVCGEPGTLGTPGDWASVIAVMHNGGTATPLVRLAHVSCSDSGIQVLDTPIEGASEMVSPATTWLRPLGSDPEALLLIGPQIMTIHTTEGGELVNTLVENLMNHGYMRPLDPQEYITPAAGLTIRIAPDEGGACVRDRTGQTLWDGRLALPPIWVDSARRERRVGVMFAYGLNLNDPTRSHIADLFESIRLGNAAASTATLLTDTQPD